MEITIRHAEAADAGQLHAILISDHVVQGSMRLPYMALKTTEDRLIAQPNRLQLVALREEEVIGFAELLLHGEDLRASHAATLNLVATKKEEQGKGVARGLVEAVIDLCDGYLGIRRLDLMVWDDNARGIKLYEGLGFEVEGRLRDYVRRDQGFRDAIAMARIK